MDILVPTLVIETASEACSVALFDGGELVANDHRVLGRGHAEQLVPMIAALPHRGRADRILVSLGPGSFTGVRIGIATARALGFAWAADVLGYPTLALIAAQAKQETDDEVTVCMNGGHGEWFIAEFASTDFDGVDPGSVGSAGNIRSLTPEQAVARGAKGRIAGNRAEEFATLLGNGTPFSEILPDAGAVMKLNEGMLTRDLSPIYGRAPDAKPQKVVAP